MKIGGFGVFVLVLSTFCMCVYVCVLLCVFFLSSVVLFARCRFSSLFNLFIISSIESLKFP